MKNKWDFQIINDWNFTWRSVLLIHMEMLSIHWEAHQRWFTIIGFSFVWSKLAYQRNRK